eukprot:15445039-Alexandrium_andersonii.AAC.1
MHRKGHASSRTQNNKKGSCEGVGGKHCGLRGGQQPPGTGRSSLHVSPNSARSPAGALLPSLQLFRTGSAPREAATLRDPRYSFGSPPTPRPKSS